MVFTEQQLQVKKLVDVQQDIEIDALNDGVGALSSTMQNGFTEAANNFLDIQNNLEAMNTLSNERYNGVTGSVNTLSNAMTQGFLDMGNTVANVAGEIQGQLNQMNANTGNMNNNIQNQFNGVNIELQNIQNNFELVNTNIGESINAYNDQITNSLSVDTLSANTLIYNVSATPVSSLTALGYDSNGKVIPVTVIANSNLQLPPSANYIYTDSTGTPYAGMPDNVVSESENLVTSHAVYNEVSNIQGNLNALRDGVDNSFWGIRNYLNGMDNNFNAVQNSFNDVNNSIDNVLGLLGFYTPMNYINSTTPVNYQALDTVVFTKGNMGNLWSESSLLGDKYYDWNSTTNTLTFSSPTGIIVFNSNMSDTFAYCSKLNQNILILNSVTDMSGTFAYCSKLNQNILIPNSVTDMSATFFTCDNLNQNILIPNSVTNMSFTFAHCYNLNQDILIPNSVTDMSGTFAHCYDLNQSILIPNRVTNMSNTFGNCSNLNQNILVPNSVTNMSNTFAHCSNLNQNILIPDSVTDMSDTFTYCSKLNQNILIPNSVTNMSNTFATCYNLNQNILIPNSVTNMSNTFTYCSKLNQNILIPDSVTNMSNTFAACSNLNQNILIPDSVTNMSNTFYNCYNLNQDIYIYSDGLLRMGGAFNSCQLLATRNIHIRSSIPMSTSNSIYNSLVNNTTGVNWTGRIYNDLPRPTTWPPAN